VRRHVTLDQGEATLTTTNATTQQCVLANARRIPFAAVRQSHGRPIVACIAIALALAAAPVSAAPGDLLFTITAPQPLVQSSFGVSLATVDGDIVVSDNTWHQPGLNAFGRVHLFDGRTGQWKLTFENPQATQHDHFAGNFSGGEGRLFISTTGLDDRIYAFSTVTGELLQTIPNPDTGSHNFGTALAYNAGNLLVGTPTFYRSGDQFPVGRANLFNAATGQLLFPIPNPEPKPGDVFGGGNAVAISGNNAVVGAQLDDLPGDNGPDGDNPGRVCGSLIAPQAKPDSLSKTPTQITVRHTF
jgi:hypothetical protein